MKMPSVLVPLLMALVTLSSPRVSWPRRYRSFGTAHDEGNNSIVERIKALLEGMEDRILAAGTTTPAPATALPSGLVLTHEKGGGPNSQGDCLDKCEKEQGHHVGCFRICTEKTFERRKIQPK